MNIKRRATDDWPKARAPVSASELAAIGKLLNTLDVAAITTSSGTIHPPDHKKNNYDGLWRVDMQGMTTEGFYNVQVQQNIKQNPSTVAAVLIPRDLITWMGKVGANAGANGAVQARNSELRYALHGALIRSARTITFGTNKKGTVDATKYAVQVYKLEGSFSCGNVIAKPGEEDKD